MATKGKTPEDWISFLLSIMDNTEATPNWNQVAITTGAYKSGKFVRQAYNNLRQKYHPLPDVGSTAAVPPTPKSGKKRAAAAEATEDDEKKPVVKAKRARKAKVTQKMQAKEEAADEKSHGNADEQSDDELNGSDSAEGQEDDD